MHELAIAQEIVKRAVAEAQRQGAARVTAFHVKLGPVGFATAANLSFCIQAASQGTIAEGARVHVRDVKKGGIALESIDVDEAPAPEAEGAAPERLPRTRRTRQPPIIAASDGRRR
ncbi:MAG: hydrogenase maturation nickel metallochaperone HypA [Chloroflexota bacterium]|nr:hydrogenase maturation nickel metallochaperone HypA [Chloroflexota bacterium]